MADLNAVVNQQLTKLTSANSGAYVNSGIVALFPDPTFAYGRYDLVIHDKTARDRHQIPRNSADNTTWVAWNLPIGVVVTLTDHHRSLGSGKNVGDLDGLGACIDLVGTGRTESADLRECGMNDIAYSWFWRQVDLRYGAVEMFCDPNFTGIRQTLFLSEWPSNKKHSLVGSHLNDNMTAVRWRSLNDNQKVTFYEHPDGGNTFSDAKGWGSDKENRNLLDVGFNDCVSAFSWEPVLPKEEKIEPIILKAPQSNTSAMQASELYHNNTGVEQKFKVTWNQSKTKTLTVSTTSTHVVGVKAGMSQKLSGGVPGVGEAEVAVSLEVSYEYTNSKVEEKSVSDTVSLTYEREVTAPPGGVTTATMTIDFGELPEQTYSTKVIRWYDQQVSGSVPDGSKRGLYRREETTQITVSGGLASKLNTRTDFKAF